MNFQQQFEALKKLGLPAGQFVIVSSGALAVRGIRESRDLDVIVTEGLWAELAKTHKAVPNGSGVETIDMGDSIEVLNPSQSFYGDSQIVPVKELFEGADEFDGIKFINLEHLRKIKERLGREKDIADIRLIDDYTAVQKLDSGQ